MRNNKSQLIIKSKGNGAVQMLKKPAIARNSILNKKPLSVVRDLGTQSLPASPERSSGANSTSEKKIVIGSSSKVFNGASTSLLKTNLPAGTSLLKRSNGMVKQQQQQNILDLDTLTELEKAIPDVSLSSWNKIVGRNPDIVQTEVESRLLKKGAASLKSYTQHMSFLRFVFYIFI